jgi:serine/threonine protein phosphatase PrpC
MRQNVDYVRDRSGSCAVVLLVTKEAFYIANVGDSRALLSKKGGKIVESITTDHKPCEPSERARIEKGGGRVY